LDILWHVLVYPFWVSTFVLDGHSNIDIYWNYRVPLLQQFRRHCHLLERLFGIGSLHHLQNLKPL
jgi:hypothetical protein